MKAKSDQFVDVPIGTTPAELGAYNTTAYIF